MKGRIKVAGENCRLKKVGAAEFHGSVAQQTGPSFAVELKEGIQVAGDFEDPLPDDPAIKDCEEKVRNEIRKGGLKNAPDLKNRLIRTLAYSARVNACEIVARGIFGTQFSALNNMNASDRLTKIALQEIHEEHEASVWSEIEESPLTFLTWVNFLTNNELAQMDPERRYEITRFGQFFLLFAANIGLNENRKF